MAEEKNLIRVEETGTLGFGDHTLASKSKLDGFEFCGDQYKVKTFSEITKLEKNGMLVYESVPGTAVTGFSETQDQVCFTVSGQKDVQITLGMEADTDYEIVVGETRIGDMTTGLSGKLSLSIELEPGKAVEVKATKKTA